MMSLSVKNGRFLQKVRGLRLLLAQKALNPFMRKLGFTVIADHFYQPIPNDKELRTYATRERPLNSIKWKLEKQVAYVEYLLKKYEHEFNDPTITANWRYLRQKAPFGRGDAEFLYTMIREYKPQNIVEVGSGASTQIIRTGLTKNYQETSESAQFLSIEPYPKPFLLQLTGMDEEGIIFQLEKTPVQKINLLHFESLGKNDILFVDSSHVYKQGSDVEFEFLQIYPLLKKGVIVHIHDIFFPFDYPLEWNLKQYRFWNEQYYLEVFLQFNEKFETLASLSMVAHRKKQVFQKFLKEFPEDRIPGSFWMQSLMD